MSLLRLLRPYRIPLGVAFAAMLVESAADLLEPWPLKIVLDYVIGSKPMPSWLAAWPALTRDRLVLLNAGAIGVVAIAILGAASSYAEKYLSTSVGQRVTRDLRHILYHHMQRLSLSFYEHHRTGDMVVRLTSDIESVQDFMSSVLLGMVLDVLTLIGMVIVMMYLDWRFTLVALSVAPLLFVVVYRLTRRIKAAARAVKEKESELASVVQESISAVREVKAFAREDYEERRLDRESEESLEAAMRARTVKARLSPLVDIIVAVGTCLVLLLGARHVMSGRLTAGALIVFVLYLGKMYKPMKDLSKLTDTISRAFVGFDRIGELLRTESQVRDLPGARPARPFAGEIALEHVRFGYVPGRPVLKDVSLHVRPGQRAALVGPSGSGKSTLIGLLPRLYDVWDGRILIDGRDIREYTLASLRDQVSFVLQDPVLFRSSVWQNIAYGRPKATREEVVKAARAANAHGFISALPQGYDTVVGERGDTLSAGQRQRIAIARAIIRDAPILLLDEPTSALDAESEALVFDAIERLTRGKTSITIAHRLATARAADVVFVIDDGVVVERGTHEELMAADGLYARLYRLQFRPDDQTREGAESATSGSLRSRAPEAATTAFATAAAVGTGPGAPTPVDG
ncbi:MAG TPA: ABC transporter ATP-binding protein [Gemmatimonadaceae bacterium]|nr:ABC transporter ATP-binding protein [Gemmatimonadaceae bacterium]